MLQTMEVLEVLSTIEQRLDRPTARDLATAVSRAIHDGELAPGAKLPPIREVARQLAMSPTTVSAGWALLARAGTIRTEGRRGTTVADSARPGTARYRRALEHPAPLSLDLSTGVPDASLLPGLGRALAEVTTAGTPGSYLDEPVLPELARVLLDSWPYAATSLTIVDGAMDAFDLVSRSWLGLGDRVVVEHPCFPPLLDLLESVGADVVGVPLDESGLEPRAFAVRYCPASGAGLRGGAGHVAARGAAPAAGAEPHRRDDDGRAGGEPGDVARRHRCPCAGG